MSIQQTHELKQLQTRLTKIRVEYEAACNEANRTNQVKQILNSQVKDLEQKIKSFEQQNVEPTITEHAMLRYIERVIGIDLEELKNRIMPAKTKQQIQTLHNGKFPGDNCRLVVKNKVVVTIEPND